MKITVGVVMAVIVAGGVLIATSNTGKAVEKTSVKLPSTAVSMPSGPVPGTTDFMPTSEHPVGWRGDWTGRYPAATPPVSWSKRPKGAYASMRIQAQKPEKGKSSGALLYKSSGIVRDWLYLVPVEAKEYCVGNYNDRKQYDTPTGMLFKETEVQPNEGDKAGKLTWKLAHISNMTQCGSYGPMTLDLAYFLNMADKCARQNVEGTIPPMLAYAHTYIWAPDTTKVRFSLHWGEGEYGSGRMWLNGNEVANAKEGRYTKYGDPFDIGLSKGWNRLLVLIPSSKRTFTFALTISPPEDAKEYETENVVWQRAMPGPSWSSPIIVGDKIFVQADPADLVCLDKKSGKILWTQRSSWLDTMTAEERNHPAFKTHVEPHLAKLKSAEEEILKSCNANDADAVRRNMRQKIESHNNAIRGMREIDSKKYTYWDQHCCTTTATPLSDGKYVYAISMGGCKGFGAQVISCHDLNGKLMWNFFSGQCSIPEHGAHASPAMANGYLIACPGNRIIMFERETGKIASELPPRRAGNQGNSPVVFNAQGQTCIATASDSGGTMFSLDKKGVFSEMKDYDGTSLATPIIADGVMYALDGLRNRRGFAAYDLNSSWVKGGDPKILWHITPQDLNMPELISTYGNMYVPSPVYHDGLLYVVTEGGALIAVDAKSGGVVYKHFLDELSPTLTWVSSDGICCSPTLAGKYIYVFDNHGQSVVFEPGRKFKLIAHNTLLDDSDSQSTPVFEGNMMYYRSQYSLYCISEGKR